jgi:uncharacterized repeat protein (TIGR01451 family)
LENAPALIVFSTHNGNFISGQSGAYAVTVWNESSQATTGTVTVTDTLPTGLTATSIGGTGWACTLATVTCTRSDALNSGASYPPITVTANVASSAAASVTNQVSVSVGGSPTASASDLTSIFSPCDLKQTGNVAVSDVQLIINEALGVTQVVYDLSGNGAVNVVDVQIEINAALGLGCAAK